MALKRGARVHSSPATVAAEAAPVGDGSIRGGRGPGCRWSSTALTVAACIRALAVAALLLTPPAEAQEWIHPQAAEQPTGRGKAIKTLVPFQGDLYAGFGDYGANTGPIAINPFDLASKTFEGPFFADTEEIEAFRDLDGRLFVPHADTRAGADYSVRSGSGWSQHDAFASLHVFDAAETPGSLWLCGSSGANGTVWRSTDGGATWQLSLSVPPWSGQAADYVRIYFCAAIDGELHVQPHALYAATPASWVFSVDAWSQAPPLTGGYAPGYHGEVFKNELVYQSFWDGFLIRLSGNPEVVSPIALEDYAVAGDRLYGLTRDTVLSTTDLTTWETVADPPESATSIAYADDSLYVGTHHATIVRVDVFPTAVADSATLAEDSGATPIDVLANDADLDGGPKTIVSTDNADHGTVAITNSGAGLTYEPAASYNGPDSFAYTLNGGSTATVSITVTAVDEATPPPPASPAPADNNFSFGKLKRNLDKGTAKLTVKVPGPGDVRLRQTKRVRKDSEQAEEAEKLRLRVRPRAAAKAKLADTGKLKVRLRVTFTPTGGEPNTKSQRVSLRRDR